MSSLNAPFPVLAHPYTSHVSGAVAYESGNTKASNALVFVGGLTDGPHSIPYVRTVAQKLEETPEIDFSLFEIRTRSSFLQFGMSSLNNDVDDIGSLVTYLRSIEKKKVVLLGHSTGCQVRMMLYKICYVPDIYRTVWNTPTTTGMPLCRLWMALCCRHLFQTARALQRLSQTEQQRWSLPSV